MARLRQSEDLASAVPFLSVLLSLVGTLLLGIVLVSIGRLSFERDREVQQAKWMEYQALLQQSEDIAEANDDLQPTIEEGYVTDEQLVELRSKIETLLKIESQADQLELVVQAAQTRLKELAARTVEKRSQRDELMVVRVQTGQEESNLPAPGSVKIVSAARLVGRDSVARTVTVRHLEQTQNILAAAGYDPGPIDGKLGPQTARALRRYQADHSIKITGELDLATFSLLGLSDRLPHFVEIRGNFAIVHPTGAKVSASKLNGQNAFQEMINRVKQRTSEGAVLIFLIRPDGVKTFDQAYEIARDEEVRVGFVPIPGFGEIDLSAFGS